MFDYLIMSFIVLFLAYDLLFGAKLLSVNECFFDKDNTKALRGFWCLIILMVHIPEMYQNKIQDMIGSFAYIGVTFFFLTSSYGLTFSKGNNPLDLTGFWKKRLPKLLIVSWIINAFFGILNRIVLGKSITILELIDLNGWVKWLIACYFAFWLCNNIFKSENKWKIATSILIICGSLLIYYLGKRGIITMTTWTTEIYGFVWGIILATYRNLFLDIATKKWKLYITVTLISSDILGVCYLMFKNIPFVGDYILKILLGVAITAFMLVSNTRITLSNKVNQFLGSISFEIYLVHLYVIDLLRDITEWSGSGIYIVACIVLTIVCATLVHFVASILLKIFNF